MDSWKDLLAIARRKWEYDRNNPWGEGSETYLKEIRKELAEVEQEIEENRVSFLEDELGDVLWDYLNVLISLENEMNIDIPSIFEGACIKYEERISGIENGVEWNEIKKKQKERLLARQNEFLHYS